MDYYNIFIPKLLFQKTKETQKKSLYKTVCISDHYSQSGHTHLVATFENTETSVLKTLLD